MVDKKIDFSLIAYILGIVSIVFGILQPLAGIVLGIVGLIYCKKQKDNLSKKAKKLNTIGIVIGVIVMILSIVVTMFFASANLTGMQNFPVG